MLLHVSTHTWYGLALMLVYADGEISALPKVHTPVDGVLNLVYLVCAMIRAARLPLRPSCSPLLLVLARCM